MRQISLIFVLIFLLLASAVPAFSQGIPAAFPYAAPGMYPHCPVRQPVRPITQTVQVDVPVPCAPVACGPALPCPPPSCAPPVCAPPPPTRPVQVRVDVVVRPEAPTPCVPQRFCCENPPLFEPIFYHAAWMLRSLVLAPLGVGESILGHGMPRQPCPPPVPIACPPRCSPPPYVEKCAPIAAQGIAPCLPSMRCAQRGPSSKARLLYGPSPAWVHPGGAPCPR